MSLIDLGITRDEAIAAGAQVGPGEYDAEFVGLLRNNETGDFVHFGKETNARMVQASFRVINHFDQNTNGKRLPIYNAVAGQFSMADLITAIPGFWGPNGPTEEGGVGTVVRVTVKYGKGEYAERTQISKLRPKR